MIKYLLNKTAILIGSLFVIITLTFFLMKLIPGDPFLNDNIIPQEVLDALHRHYGLDKPLFVQYITYIKNLLHGDLGPSYIYIGRQVQSIIQEGFPVSFFLGLEALIIALILGTCFGSIAAFYKGQWQDTSVMIIATLGISIPSFLIATFLQYFLSIKLSIFPVARWTDFSSTIMPALSLSAMPCAFIARLVRANMLEVMQQNYILTAKAKGLSSTQIILHHALRNAILPVISYLGPVSAQILTGSFIIEKIFAIPGLGQWLIMSISNRDYTVIMGITIFYAAILITIVFLVDIIYGLIDPRIKIRTIDNEN